MAQYEIRAARFNRSIPGIFAQYTRGIVTADVEGKVAYLDFVKDIFATPNLTLEQKIDIIDQNALSLGVSVPAASLIDLASPGVERAELKMSMTVSAHQETAKDRAASGEVSGSVTGGWGPVKAQIGFKAQASTSSQHKRSSDYSSTTDATLIITRQPVPETLSRISDMMAEVTSKAMEINMLIVQQQSEAIMADLDSQEILPADPTTERYGDPPPADDTPTGG